MVANSDKVTEITAILQPESKAAWVRHLWDTYNTQRAEWISEKRELRNYIFATDTTKTTNSTLPWKNSTTLPKLCQIRDNLHSNYISALFPNDKWLIWDAFTRDAAKKETARNITAYMDNKAREGRMKKTVSELVLDYIDGNAFATTTYESRINTSESGERTTEFTGPKLVRISPYDIVFDPTAADFENTWKIVRSIKTLGELKKLATYNPNEQFWADALDSRMLTRAKMEGFTKDDFDKAEAYAIDGFGSMFEYFHSEYMEILEFYGDYHDPQTGEMHTDIVITVVDRTSVVRDERINTYNGRPKIRHIGWRKRPDNLYAMGPLDNLVGMQYRIDHLENAKADAMDLAIQPPLAITGDVEHFDWGPSAEVHLEEGGDVKEILKNLNAIITSDNQIQMLEDKMELFAGAPREAMGVRSPGEKTAFEVQSLENASGRIFQEKTVNFEENFLELLLNDCLEEAHRNLNTFDIIKVVDTDIGAQSFMEVTREDITASGILRPIGARHFAQKAQDMQNLVGVFSSPIGQIISPHTSGISLTEFVNNTVDLRGYDVFRPNIAVVENAETQRMMNQAQEDLEVEAGTPAEDEAVTNPQDLENDIDAVV